MYICHYLLPSPYIQVNFNLLKIIRQDIKIQKVTAKPPTLLKLKFVKKNVNIMTVLRGQSMRKNIKFGFTLSEVLVTLTVVGVLAILVIPATLRDTTNKSMISLLQSTVANLTDAFQAEIVRAGAKDVTDTRIYTDKVNYFTKNLDTVKRCSTAPIDTDCFKKIADYKILNGGTIGKNSEGISLNLPFLLKNGVSVNISNLDGITKDKNQLPIDIDLNAINEPNVVGIDLFTVCLTLKSIPANLDSIGEIKSCTLKNVTKKWTPKDALNECKKGNNFECYNALELTGFDQNYIRNIERGDYD